jgi:hypothetical protein
MDFTGIGSVADLAKGLIDRFFPPDISPGEKAQRQLELQTILYQRENSLIEAKKEILIAELNQSDNYTKRARPTIIYGGLAFIFLVHVFIPLFSIVSQKPFPVSSLSLPSEFWLTWGGVCGVYVWGRTKEKQGLPLSNPIINSIMGKK